MLPAAGSPAPAAAPSPRHRETPAGSPPPASLPDAAPAASSRAPAPDSPAPHPRPRAPVPAPAPPRASSAQASICIGSILRPADPAGPASRPAELVCTTRVANFRFVEYRNGRSAAIRKISPRRRNRSAKVCAFQVKNATGCTTVRSSRLPSTRQYTVGDATAGTLGDALSFVV